MRPFSNSHDTNSAAFRQCRREFLARTASGVGMMALSSLLGGEQTQAATGPAAADDPLATNGMLGRLDYAPKAKRVIYLFQAGGPSHIDLFDYKPVLNELQDKNQDVPKEILGNQRVTLMTRNQSRFKAFGSRYQFSQHGESGAWFSDLLPHMAGVADKLCFIKSMQAGPINHDPAMNFMQTGRQIAGRPAMGSWLHYGLGSEAADLPAYVVMTCGVPQQPILSRYYHSGYLPSKYQGVQFQSSGDPVLFLTNPEGITHADRGQIIETVNDLNRIKLEQTADQEIEARIDAFQMAYQMQTSVPDLTDISDEPEHVLKMYGPDVQKQGTFAYQCLLARRLAQRGVRFVQIFHAGWDHHGGLHAKITRQAGHCDQASAALIKDLEQQGMLEDTIVVWGGEFGRTAYTQGGQAKPDGRDHHPRCFTMALAGGGFKPGVTYGATDDFGYNIASDVVHVRDLHATMLKLLGINHKRLSFRIQGLDSKLTGVLPCRILDEILV